MPKGFQVDKAGDDLYRVEGVTAEELASALNLWEAAQRLQAEEAPLQRPHLLRAMLLAGVDPVPPATVAPAQARRLARHRERLLASGAHTTDSLQRLRGDSSAGVTRTWLARRRRSGEVFTVAHEGTTLVPVFQLDERGEPRPGLRPALEALQPLGMRGWELWGWFTSTSTWLDGARPAELLDTSPRLVTDAARRFGASSAA
ncbi:MAG: hypothetical protein ACRDYD_08965 [Acidimicrobiales bacterium]